MVRGGSRHHHGMAKSSTPNRSPKKKGGVKKKHPRDWAKYNDELVQRGSIDVWVEKGLVTIWEEPANEGKRKRGAKRRYSDTAIVTVLRFGAVFHQRLRQTEGFVRSIFRSMSLELSVPDFTTLSRRGATVAVTLPKRPRETVVAIMDSTGLKVCGEGEWKVRQHGYSKRRTWRKFHVMISADGEIRAVEFTENSVADSQVAGNLLKQEPAKIDGLAGDGGYDRQTVYAAGQERAVGCFLIPPQKNARIRQHGNTKTNPHPRDVNLRQIRKTSRKCWKEQSGYHIRSLVETTMFRLKTIFGDRLHARNFENQRTEALIKASSLNQMWALGRPGSPAAA